MGKQIHMEYKEMTQKLLMSKLSLLGLTAEQYTEAMQNATKTRLNSHLLQYILAIDDFKTFQNIMIQRNIELEKEAIQYLSQQNDRDSLDIHNMTEEQQLQLALSESLTISQTQTPIKQLPNKEEIITKPQKAKPDNAPTTKQSDQIKQDVNNDNVGNNDMDNNPFDIIENINMNQPKRVSLKPLKLKKSGNTSFESTIKNDEDLPTLTAASIRKIKLKQSSNQNVSILKQKRMILNMRKKKRKEQIKTMEPGAPGWNVDINKVDTSHKSSLPPLHKSLFAKMVEGNDDNR